MGDSRGYGPTWDQVTVDEWLATLASSDVDDPVVDFAFPNEVVKSDYLDSIALRTDEEVRDLLRRILMKTGELGSDELRVDWLKRLFMGETDEFGKAMKVEYNRRLVGLDAFGEPAWQGLSWILDLLPRWPMRAIEVLEAYFLAHMLHLPDGRIWGIGDAQEIIRAMWIGNPSSASQKLDLLYELGPRKFEHLIDELFDSMGYATVLTPSARDGGRDIEVERDEPGKRERSLVECKLWTRRVGVTTVRPVLGLVGHERATKGIVVTASSFTRPARELAQADPRLELIGWAELLPLLDEHLGDDWARGVDWHITSSMRRAGLP